MDAALAAVQRLARNSVDDATRSKVIVGLRDLMYTLESQDDTIDRIIFSVRDLGRPKASHYPYAGSDEQQGGNV